MPETGNLSKYKLQVVFEQNQNRRGAGWIPKGLLKRDEFPVRGTSNPLLWASFTVWPQRSQPQGRMSIFCGLEFGQLALTLYVIWWMTGTYLSRCLWVLIVPDLSSTQVCWLEPCFQNTGFLAWLSPGLLPSPWVLHLWVLYTVSTLLGQAQSCSLSFHSILPHPTPERPIHTHARPQLLQILYMTHKFASITQTFPLSSRSEYSNAYLVTSTACLRDVSYSTCPKMYSPAPHYTSLVLFQCSQLVSYKARNLWIIPYPSPLFSKFDWTLQFTNSNPLNPRLPSDLTWITGLYPCIFFDSFPFSCPQGSQAGIFEC